VFFRGLSNYPLLLLVILSFSSFSSPHLFPSFPLLLHSLSFFIPSPSSFPLLLHSLSFFIPSPSSFPLLLLFFPSPNPTIFPPRPTLISEDSYLGASTCHWAPRPTLISEFVGHLGATSCRGVNVAHLHTRPDSSLPIHIQLCISRGSTH